MQRSVAKDVPLGGRVASDKLILQLKLSHEPPDWRWKTRALRAQFEKIAVPPRRADDPARTRLCLQNKALGSELLKPKGAS